MPEQAEVCEINKAEAVAVDLVQDPAETAFARTVVEECRISQEHPALSKNALNVEWL